MQYLIE